MKRTLGLVLATLLSTAAAIADMTPVTPGTEGESISAYDWTNAMVVALGAVNAGDITIVTLPPKTVVRGFYVAFLNTSGGGTVATLTVSCGRVSPLYIDYLPTVDARSPIGKVFGGRVGGLPGERGVNLSGYDTPSYNTGTTLLKCHFTAVGDTLNHVNRSVGRVFLATTLLP